MTFIFNLVIMNKIKYLWDNQDKIQDFFDKFDEQYREADNSHCQDEILKEFQKKCNEILKKWGDLEI